MEAERRALRTLASTGAFFAAVAFSTSSLAVRLGWWFPFCTTRGTRIGQQLWPWLTPSLAALPGGSLPLAAASVAAWLGRIASFGWSDALGARAGVTAAGAAELLLHLCLAAAFLALLGTALELWRGVVPRLDAPHSSGLLPQVAISPHLPISPRISPYLPISSGNLPQVTLLATSSYISPYLIVSTLISPYLAVSPAARAPPAGAAMVSPIPRHVSPYLPQLVLLLLAPPALLALLLGLGLEGFTAWWRLASALFLTCALLEPLLFRLLEPWALLAAGPRTLVGLLRAAPLPAREGAQLQLWETVAARGGWLSALVAAEALEQRDEQRMEGGNSSGRMRAQPPLEVEPARVDAPRSARRGRWRRVLELALQSRCLLVPP